MLFPGQGSQSVGMLAGLSKAFPQVGQTLDEAAVVLGFDLRKLVENGPEDELGRAEVVQPAILAADVAVWRAWRSLDVPAPTALAGHSLGEYAALVCAGALAFGDALKLVELRGRLMKEAAGAKGGGMAAVLGLADEAVAQVCAASPAGEMLEPANLNAPGQVVMAGSTAALDWLLANGKDYGARKVVKLPMPVPSHCSVMKPAAAQLAERLATIDVQTPAVRVLHNVDTRARNDTNAIREALTGQLYSPVRWAETIAALVAAGVDTLLECGPGRVLGGLNKRNARGLASFSLEDAEQLRAAAQAVAVA